MGCAACSDPASSRGPEAGAVIRGTVTTEGRSVAAVAISAYLSPNDQPCVLGPGLGATTTDSLGNYRLNITAPPMDSACLFLKAQPPSAAGLKDTTLGPFRLSLRVAAPLDSETVNFVLTTVTGTAPVILSLSPQRRLPGSDPFYLVVNGDRFADSAKVLWNDAPRPTTFDSPSRLVAFIGAADVASSDMATVQVVNPNGGRSGIVPFIIALSAVPFRIDSNVPHTGTDGSPGSFALVYFNEPLDPASLNDTSLEVLENGVSVGGKAHYDAATRSLRLDVPLALLRSYMGRVSNEIRSISGGGLDAIHWWNFTTALGTIVDFGPGDFGTLALGISGAPQIAYRGPGGLLIRQCTGDCTSFGQWTTSTIDPIAGLYPSLIVDRHGRSHIAYQDFGNDAAKYAVVGGGSVIVQAGGYGAFPAIAADSFEHLHLAYFASGPGDLRVAICALPCTTATKWIPTTVDSAGNVGVWSTIAVDPTHRVHIVYVEDSAGDLRYATCAGPCSTPNFVLGAIDTVGRVGVGASLVVGSNGAVHIGYLDVTNGAVKYATCATACEQMSNWSNVAVAKVADPPWNPGFYYVGLGVSTTGQLDMAFANLRDNRVDGASCSSACTMAGGWTTRTLSLRGLGYGRYMSLRVDAAGLRHVAWTDWMSNLQYMRY